MDFLHTSTIMANNKKSSKSKQKSITRNLNNETIAALKRLSAALRELDNKCTNTSYPVNTESARITGFPINHYKSLPDEVSQSYKMLEDAAKAIHTVSTKYTLMNKINLEDGSKFSTDLRQGCELISTAAFLVHQPVSGCGRATRTFLKSKSLAIVISVTSLVEAFVSGEGLNGNVGAQLTGAVWQACDDVGRLPKGNRACMRRELFGWIQECNETMEEFQEIIELGPAKSEEDGATVSADSDPIKEGQAWDQFCTQAGTGEQFTSVEMPIVEASLALIKCSRGILNLSLKACDCAGNEVTALEDIEMNGDDAEAKSAAKSRKLEILQWISNLHETCRKIGEGATDLGCVMYPPLNFSTQQNDEPSWTETEIGSQTMEQSNFLLVAANSIHDAIPGEGEEQMEMSEEVKEMCSKLLSAIERRSNEVKVGINDAL